MQEQQILMTPAQRYLDAHEQRINPEQVFPRGDLVAIPNIEDPHIFEAFLTNGLYRKSYSGFSEGGEPSFPATARVITRVQLYSPDMSIQSQEKQTPRIVAISFCFPDWYFKGVSRDGETMELDRSHCYHTGNLFTFPYFITARSGNLWRITSPSLIEKVRQGHELLLKTSGEDSVRL